MAQYTISCRQTLEYQAVVEAQSESNAKYAVSDECREHGQIVDQDFVVFSEIDDEEACLNEASLFATQPF